MGLSKEAFLLAGRRKVEKVEGREIEGAPVYVRELTAEEAEEWADMVRERSEREGDKIFLKRSKGMVSWLVVRTACDDAGNLLFEPSDAAAVGELSNKFLEPIIDAAFELSKLGKHAAEDAEKNSETTPTGNSSSD